jgi:Ribosome recycling factor
MPTTTKHKATERMDSAMEHLKRELSGLRTGRASTALLDNIKVDYYGNLTPLKQVANVRSPKAASLPSSRGSLNSSRRLRRRSRRPGSA